MNEMIVKIGEKKKNVQIIDEIHVIINDKLHEVNLSKVSDYLYLIRIDEKVYEVTTTKKSSEKYDFTIDGRFISVTVRTTLEDKANEVLKQREALSKHEIIKAPMPGLLLRIMKKEGEHVETGEPLIVLEAMKMENEIRSPSSGMVTDIMFKEGDSVEKDAVILKIQ